MVIKHGERTVADSASVVADAGPPDVSQRSGRRPARRRRARQHSPSHPAQGESRNSHRNRGIPIFKVLKRVWIPLVIVAVLISGGLIVSRLHGVFGRDDRISYSDTRVDDARTFNPKYMTYEIFGPPGSTALISYFDANGDPQHIDEAPLPWSLRFEITAVTIGSIMAQGDSDSIGCRIMVEDEVKAEKVSHQVNAFTSCLLKSA